MFHLLNWCYVFCVPSGFRRNNAVSLYWYQGEGRECFASAGISVWVSRWKAIVSVWAEGCLCEWRENKKKKRKEPGFVFLVNAGIAVWIPRRGVRFSQSESSRDIYGNRKERDSGFCFGTGICFWVPNKQKETTTQIAPICFPVLSWKSVWIPKRGGALSCCSWKYIFGESPCENVGFHWNPRTSSSSSMSLWTHQTALGCLNYFWWLLISPFVVASLCPVSRTFRFLPVTPT